MGGGGAGTKVGVGAMKTGGGAAAGAPKTGGGGGGMTGRGTAMGTTATGGAIGGGAGMGGTGGLGGGPEAEGPMASLSAMSPFWRLISLIWSSRVILARAARTAPSAETVWPSQAVAPLLLIALLETDR